MSKLWCCVVATVLVASLCASSVVFGDSTPKAKSSATTTLTLIGIGSAHQKGTDNQIAGFKKANPDIDVKPTYLSGAGPVSQLQTTQINAGNPPDIMHVAPGNAIPSLYSYAKAGQLADLSKEPWVRTLPKALKTAVSYRNKVYAVPLSNYMPGLVYNKTVYKKARIGLPKTFTQMIAGCKAIRARVPGVTPIGIALVEQGQSVASFLTVFTQLVDPNFNSLKARKKTSFASNKGFKETFATFNRMKAAGCFSPGAAGTTGAQAIRDVQSGASASYLYVNIILGTMRQAAAAQGQELGFAGMPGKTAKVRHVPVATTTYAASAKGNVAAAKKFLAYLAAPANNNGYNKISGGISTKALTTGKLPAGNEAVGSLIKRKGVLIPGWYFDWPNPAMLPYAGKEFQAWFTGQSPSDGSKMLKGLDYLFDNPTAANPPN